MIARALLLLLLLAGCPAPAAQTGVPVTGPWTLRDGGVGALQVGEPIPAGLAVDPAAYFATYVADGQPAEGFDLETPPLRVVFDGPFKKYDATHGLGEPPVDKLRDRAVKAAATAPIKVLIVRDPSLKTEAGVGVGSTLAQIEAAHGEPQLGAVPPTLGDDRCRATVASMPSVHFVFPSCDAARDGAPATRVDVWVE